MNGEAERYLRRATRGLWGKRRQEVREELAAHLEGRVTAYQIAGLSEHDAIEKALAELGSPRLVNTGMARLYTLPTVMGSGLVVAVLCLSVMALWPKSFAQPAVIGSFYWPSLTCTVALRTDSVLGAYEACRRVDNSLWLDPQAFTRTLEAQGVTVRRGENALTLGFSDAPQIRVPLGASAVTFSDLNTEPGKVEKFPAVPGALSLWDVLKSVGEQSELPIRVEGNENPAVYLGDVSFQVGTKLRSVDGAAFYDSYLENVFYRDLIRPIEERFSTFSLNPRVDIGTPLAETVLEVSAVPGTYGIVTLLNPVTLKDFLAYTQGSLEDTDLYVSFEVVQIEKDTFTANLPEGPVRFVEAFTAKPESGTAMLVRLSGEEGKGWYEVVAPKDITLTARP